MDEPSASEHLPQGAIEVEAIAMAVGALVTTLVRWWLLRAKRKASSSTSIRR